MRESRLLISLHLIPKEKNKVRKFVLAALATLVGSTLAGCTETLPKKETETSSVATSTQPAAQANQTEMVAIAMVEGMTDVGAFVHFLGQPQTEKPISEGVVQALWISNRLTSASQGETPVVVILPPNDPRIEKMAPLALIIQAKKVKDGWILEGAHLGPINAEKKEAQK